MRYLLAATFMLISSLFFLGCGSGEYADSKVSYASNESFPAIAGNGWNAPSESEKQVTGKSDADTVATLPAVVNRRIIYNSSVDIRVKDFTNIPDQINTLVDQFGGFIGNANVGTMSGKQRSGNWVVRIPVENYRDFLSAVGNIGILESQSENTNDVTEEYVDIEARIANKQKLEARIIELLEKHDDRLSDLIQMEQELSRVREEIERMSGRLRYLSEVTSLATIDISAREEMEYIPAQAPGFSERIDSAWSMSLTKTKQFFENAAVYIVGNAIPFGIVLILGIIAFPFLRRLYRFGKKHLHSHVADAQSQQA